MKKALFIIFLILPYTLFAQFTLNIKNDSRMPYTGDFFVIHTTPKLSANDRPIFYFNNKPLVSTYSLTKNSWVVPPLLPGKYSVTMGGVNSKGFDLRSNTVNFFVYGSN